MVQQPYDIIVVGAGISGLSMAYYWASQGMTALVLERETRLGGCIHTHHLAGSDFWLELGAHSCFNSYGNLLSILEENGFLPRLCNKEKVKFKLWVDEQLQSIPSQLNFLELLFSLPRLLIDRKSGRSVAQYYSKIVGRKNFERVFLPALNAVICQPAGHFPADRLFAPKRRRKDVMRSFTFAAGLRTLIEILARQRCIEVRSAQPVETMTHRDHDFSLTLADGTHYRSRFLALATPVAVTADLLKGSFPELAGLLGRIPMATVETVGVVVPKEALTLAPLAGIIASDDRFFSVVTRDTVQDPNYRGFTFHFKPGQLDERGKLACLCRVLGIGGQPLQDKVSVVHRLPALTVGHGDLIGEVDRLLVAKPLALTGNYYTGLSLEDCITRSRRECRRLQEMRGSERHEKPMAMRL